MVSLGTNPVHGSIASRYKNLYGVLRDIPDPEGGGS